MGIDDHRENSARGISYCCLCGDHLIRKVDRAGRENIFTCTLCGGLQHLDCVQRLRSVIMCGVKGKAMTDHPSVLGYRVALEQRIESHTEGILSHLHLGTTPVNQVRLDQYHQHLSTVPQRPGCGHLMLKDTEATIPEPPKPRTVNLAYERGKATWRITKTPVCTCVRRSAKRRRQANEGIACLSCRLPVPANDEAGMRCGYCFQDPADHVHDTCPNRYVYEPLFKK